jgi:excisionase family DNA binding protein
MKEICRRLKVHKATIYRWIKAGEFPEPSLKKFGTRRWDAAQIDKFDAIGRNRSHPD